MFEKFIKYIEDKRLLKKGDRVLLAVSGGIDSMVMADLFKRAGFSGGIAHCNFSLRGKESDKDEELVRTWAGKNGFSFYSMKFDTKAYAKKNGISTQMAARDLRYAWFEELRKSEKYDSIAIAHNLNDNIETILINLTRGTGIAGLAGIKPALNNIIRPLLFATRDEISEYCRENNIVYREDRSNAETKYTRNKIRHLVLPVLKDINPSVELTLNDFSERISEAEKIISIHLQEISARIIRKSSSGIRIPVSELKALKSNKTIIYELFRPYGITGPLTDDLITILTGRSGKQIFTSTHRIVKDRNDIIIRPIGPPANESIIIENINDLKKVSFIRSYRKTPYNSKFRIPADKNIACLDPDTLTFPLIVRKWEKGDWFYPFGMTKKKKLSDFFTDLKYSVHDKDQARIIESDGRIVWIVGERIDNRFRITDSTKSVLVIEA